MRSIKEVVNDLKVCGNNYYSGGADCVGCGYIDVCDCENILMMEAAELLESLDKEEDDLK